MRKVLKRLENIFKPKELGGLDLYELMDAFNDPAVRKQWLWEVCEELKRMNLEVDRRLLLGGELKLTDLAARRKAIQDVLELVQSAKRQTKGNNPTGFDLDAVTA